MATSIGLVLGAIVTRFIVMTLPNIGKSLALIPVNRYIIKVSTSFSFSFPFDSPLLR